MTEAAVAPLAPPAIGKLEHAVAPVEANDANRMAAEEFSPGLRHRDDAAGRIHERLVHHEDRDEAVRNLGLLNLVAGAARRTLLPPVAQCRPSVLPPGSDDDA